MPEPNVKFNQPNKPFSELSRSYKDKLVARIKDLFILLSGDSTDSFTAYLCESGFGKTYLFPYYFKKNTLSMLTNVRELHQKTPDGQKPAILSLVASEFSYQFLKENGFDISRSQHSRAAFISKNSKATLQPYKRVMPKSKQKLSEEKIERIITLCLEYATVSNDRKKRKTPFVTFQVPNYSQDINYDLNVTKKDIFRAFKEKYPDESFGLSTIYKYIPNNFLAPEKKLPPPSSAQRKASAEFVVPKPKRFVPQTQYPTPTKFVMEQPGAQVPPPPSQYKFMASFMSDKPRIPVSQKQTNPPPTFVVQKPYSSTPQTQQSITTNNSITPGNIVASQNIVPTNHIVPTDNLTSDHFIASDNFVSFNNIPGSDHIPALSNIPASDNIPGSDYLVTGGLDEPSSQLNIVREYDTIQF